MNGVDLCKNVSIRISNKTIIKCILHYLISLKMAVIKTDNHPSQMILRWLNIEEKCNHASHLQSGALGSNISALILLAVKQVLNNAFWDLAGY